MVLTHCWISQQRHLAFFPSGRTRARFQPDESNKDLDPFDFLDLTGSFDEFIPTARQVMGKRHTSKRFSALMYDHRFVTLIGWLAPAWILICGCGVSDEQYISSEEAAVKEAISNFSEPWSNAKRFAALFVEGAVPDASTLKRFEPYMPSASRVSVSGNLATVDVEFEELTTGNILGPAEWTLEKVGDQWKIKTCPLP